MRESASRGYRVVVVDELVELEVDELDELDDDEEEDELDELDDGELALVDVLAGRVLEVVEDDVVGALEDVAELAGPVVPEMAVEVVAGSTELVFRVASQMRTAASTRIRTTRPPMTQPREDPSSGGSPSGGQPSPSPGPPGPDGSARPSPIAPVSS
jgi:hypothetical protein